MLSNGPHCPPWELSVSRPNGIYALVGGGYIATALRWGDSGSSVLGSSLT